MSLRRGSKWDAANSRLEVDVDGTAALYINDSSPYLTVASGLTVTAGGLTVTAGNLTLADGNAIAVGTSSGTKIGTATTQKLGFWNATPVVQQSHIANPSGGTTVDTEARAAIASINALCATLGLMAAS